ncbi:MAG TPA: hypothetical protein VNE82_02875 [Candidatus Binataceae bacterium]|nr:hypothetical protein [Candidatus Binataceae bacterium]
MVVDTVLLSQVTGLQESCWVQADESHNVTVAEPLMASPLTLLQVSVIFLLVGLA